MPVSDDYIEFIRESLQPLGQLRAKRMFGGAGLYCNELFFAIIVDDELYLKVDEQTRNDFSERGLQPFRFESKSGKVSTMNYYPVPAELLDDPEQLQAWAGKALAVAARARK